MNEAPERRLDEYDEVEWRDVARKLRPDWTDEDFKREWQQFLALKAAMGDVGGSA